MGVTAKTPPKRRKREIGCKWSLVTQNCELCLSEIQVHDQTDVGPLLFRVRNQSSVLDLFVFLRLFSREEKVPPQSHVLYSDSPHISNRVSSKLSNSHKTPNLLSTKQNICGEF